MLLILKLLFVSIQIPNFVFVILFVFVVSTDICNLKAVAVESVNVIILGSANSNGKLAGIFVNCHTLLQEGKVN